MPEIILIIGKLELAKQIKELSGPQRQMLAELLYDLNETREQIQKRADSVMLLETYGTIAFQYWVSNDIAILSRPMPTARDAELCIKCQTYHKDWQPCPAVKVAESNKVAELMRQTKDKLSVVK